MASTAIGCTVEALTVGALQRYWEERWAEGSPHIAYGGSINEEAGGFCRLGKPSRVLCQSPLFLCTPDAMERRPVPIGYYGWETAREMPYVATLLTSSHLGDRSGTPATEVPVTVEASPLVSASTGTPVPVEVEATAGAPASPEAGPSGVGGGIELGWRKAKRKKKRRKKKGGKKPKEAVALADLKAELSTISIGDSQAQGQGEEVMEGVVEGEGGDGRKGVAFSGGKGKGAAPQPSSASPSVGPAFDAHFHLDRLTGKEKGKLSVGFI